MTLSNTFYIRFKSAPGPSFLGVYTDANEEYTEGVWQQLADTTWQLKIEIDPTENQDTVDLGFWGKLFSVVKQVSGR